MSELFDKEMNAQKESLKKLPGFTQPAPVCPRKSVKETKKQKNDARVKMFLVEGSRL